MHPRLVTAIVVAIPGGAAAGLATLTAGGGLRKAFLAYSLAGAGVLVAAASVGAARERPVLRQSPSARDSA